MNNTGMKIYFAISTVSFIVTYLSLTGPFSRRSPSLPGDHSSPSRGHSKKNHYTYVQVKGIRQDDAGHQLLVLEVIDDSVSTDG